MARIKRSGGPFAALNTKLPGPVKWSCFHLCGIPDSDHRWPPGPCIPLNTPPDCFVLASPDRSARVGWRVEPAESAIEFKALCQDAMAKHAVPPNQLMRHADRGGALKAKATALMLADLGVVKSLGQAAYFECQPFLRGPVQDAEISAGIPQTLPNHRRGPHILPTARSLG